MTKDELVEKIKKILALAESSNPNEAAVAAITFRPLFSYHRKICLWPGLVGS